MTMIGAIVSIPFILTPALCMAEDDPSRSYIISTMILVTGIVTLIQTTVGCRYYFTKLRYETETKIFQRCESSLM